jgi:drug/metabolite transporter (DMT)-like permease
MNDKPITTGLTAVSAAVVAAFACIYVIWGTTYFAIAIAIQTVPPFVAGAARFLIAALLMYAWLRIRSDHVFAGVNPAMAALCGVLLSGIGNGFVIWAQQGIPSGIAALIVTFMPALVLILDWMFFSRRAPGTRALVGVSIALAGVVIIVAHTHELSGTARPLYLVAMIAAPIGWSFGTLLQKRAANSHTVLSFTCAQMFAGGVFQLVMATLDNEWSRLEVSAMSLASLSAVAYLIVFGSIVTLNAYLWLLTRVSAQKVTTYALVNPIVALLLGALFLGERMTLLAIAATAMVLLGVALVLFQDFRPWQSLRARRARAALRDA